MSATPQEVRFGSGYFAAAAVCSAEGFSIRTRGLTLYFDNRQQVSEMASALDTLHRMMSAVDNDPNPPEVAATGETLQEGCNRRFNNRVRLGLIEKEAVSV